MSMLGAGVGTGVGDAVGTGVGARVRATGIGSVVDGVVVLAGLPPQAASTSIEAMARRSRTWPCYRAPETEPTEDNDLTVL
jgi:hypothetical protein